MKNLKIISLFLLLGFSAFAQSYQELDINNLKVGFNAAGDMLYHPGSMTPGLYFNNTALPLSAANLWIGGFSQGQLHISAQTYRQSGSDFWAGPLDSFNYFCDSLRNIAFSKVWKLNCNEVNDFVNYTQGQGPAGYTVPMDIQTWPGNGNAALGEGHLIAPYFDSDGDGYYNWTAGDYPLAMGQQSLFYVYNDSLQNVTHTETGSRLGLEIRTMPYAFELPWNNAISNTVFIHYTIINRTTIPYDSTIIGVWSDLDLQVPSHSGSDSILSCFYNYDSTTAAGIVFLNQPMAGYIAYDNDFSTLGNPSSSGEYYQYLQHRWKDNLPLTYNGNGYGGTTNSNWMYSGDPSTGSGWNETGNIDQRNVGAGQPFTLQPGMVYTFDIALVLAKDTSAPYSCVTSLKQSIQEVKNFYATESQFCIPGVTGIHNEEINSSSIKISPNPTADQLTIQMSSLQSQSYTIVDLTGKLLQSGNTSGKETTIDVQKLPAGMYFLRVGDEAKIQTLKFVKAE